MNRVMMNVGGDTPVVDLPLSLRTWNRVVDAIGVHATVAQLCNRTEKELMQTMYFGRKAIKEINGVLAEYGYAIGSETRRAIPFSSSLGNLRDSLSGCQ